MRSTALWATLLLALPSVAGTVRCGTDDFGNSVCLDSAGVVTAAPPLAGSGVPAAGTAGLSGGKPVRCGVDPFGNTVCR